MSADVSAAQSINQSLSTEDAQQLETRKFDVADIATDFVVQQHLIGQAGQPAVIPASIGAAFPGVFGAVYAGILRSLDGKPDSHLILLDGEALNADWEQAQKWAASIGGELPTRREQRLLFVNLKDQFEEDWYWSGEQYAANPDYAWGQIFDNGNQYYYHKSYAGRARAVRRLPI